MSVWINGLSFPEESASNQKPFSSLSLTHHPLLVYLQFERYFLPENEGQKSFQSFLKSSQVYCVCVFLCSFLLVKNRIERNIILLKAFLMHKPPHFSLLFLTFLPFIIKAR